MQNQYEKDLKTKEKLLELHSHKDQYGQWYNNVPLYRKHIIIKIRDWIIDGGGKQTAKEAQAQGWYSLNNRIGYSNYIIPDCPCESLVGYLNIVLLKQYFLFYGIVSGYYLPRSEKIWLKILPWLNSHAFRDEVLLNTCPSIRYKPEHLNLIRDSVLK